MTTTDIQGFIETTDGGIFPVYTNITDGATMVEVKVVDDAGGNAQSLYAYLRNRVITRIALQASDGSILDAVKILDNGRPIVWEYGGERVASSPSAANIDIWDLAVPVSDTTFLYCGTTD